MSLFRFLLTLGSHARVIVVSGREVVLDCRTRRTALAEANRSPFRDCQVYRWTVSDSLGTPVITAYV